MPVCKHSKTPFDAFCQENKSLASLSFRAKKPMFHRHSPSSLGVPPRNEPPMSRTPHPLRRLRRVLELAEDLHPLAQGDAAADVVAAQLPRELLAPSAGQLPADRSHRSGCARRKRDPNRCMSSECPPLACVVMCVRSVESRGALYARGSYDSDGTAKASFVCFVAPVSSNGFSANWSTCHLSNQCHPSI